MKEELSFFHHFVSVLKKLFEKFGISPNLVDKVDSWLFVLALILISILFSWILRLLIKFLLPRIFKKTKSRVIKQLLKHRVFLKLIYLFPPVIILPFLPLAYQDYPKFISVTERICWIYFIVSTAIYINYLLGVIFNLFYEGERGKNIPLHGVMQLIKGIVFTLALIVVISIIINKSPFNLITGLGAFAAVLMLIFKDTILGLVAGVQLMQNDIARKGDWITTDNEKINGIIEDITLNTVKVRNYDNTILTIPPYLLISSTLQNWRAMQESGGRRILVTFIIEAGSIISLSDEQLKEWERVELLSGYIAQKRMERDGKRDFSSVNNNRVYGTIDTNLGLFRAYSQLYINSLPDINKSMLSMIRLLEPTDNGIPIQIYCFSLVTEWKGYEAVRSEITEHIFSASKMFGLRVFQNASGYHYLSEAYITVGKNMPG